MRVVEIGDKLISTIIYITYNSVSAPEILFWEDSAATQPSDLSSVVSSSLEVDVNGVVTSWPGTIVGNRVTITLTAADTTVSWDTKPFNLVFMKPLRTVVLSGEVQVQR